LSTRFAAASKCASALKWLLAFATVVVCGCASRQPQTDEFFESRERPAGASAKQSTSKTIDDVPFVRQESGQCGPASLAMVMAWAGKPKGADELAKEVYTPGMKGSLQLDLITAVRREGLLAIPINGFAALVAELSDGHPVIVFENLGLSWLPYWHYAVAYGYDLQARTLTFHSGPKEKDIETFASFEKDWVPAENWGLVILPPGQLANSAGELAQVRAAAALEQLGFLPEAAVSYDAVLKRWPESLSANIGAANVAYSRNDEGAAVAYLERATAAHPDSASAWHNLAIAEGALENESAARASARKALELASPREKSSYGQELKEWLKE
jgi:tetratricopeptide (TPR) repeat protein